MKDSCRWSLAKETIARRFTACFFERWNDPPLMLVYTCLKVFLVISILMATKFSCFNFRLWMCQWKCVANKNFPIYGTCACYVLRFMKCPISLLIHRYISPHIDSTSSCGNAIAGLSLLSTTVIKLQHQNIATWIAGLLWCTTLLDHSQHHIAGLHSFFLVAHSTLSGKVSSSLD